MLDSKDAIQLFTSQAIHEIARGDYSLLYKVVNEYLKPRFRTIKISDIFNLTLDKVSFDYKNEYFYKNIIANKILLRKHTASNATMLTEFRVGKSKADCVILNGSSTCYEIKTEFDSLKRLPEQLSEYSKIFDKVNVISCQKHLPKIIELAPRHIGIFELTKKNALKEIRKADKISSEIDASFAIQSLRMDEYLYIASKIVGSNVKTNNMEAYSHCLEIMRTADSDKLRTLFRNTLKKYRSLDQDIFDSIPEALVTSFISYRIKPSDRVKLKTILNKYIDKENLCISL